MTDPAVRWRRWSLAGATLGLLLGVYTGLGRAGIEHHLAAADLHGVVMVLGFVGTIVALVQARRLGRPWGYLAPMASTLALPALVIYPPLGGALLLVAGLVVTASSMVVARRTQAPPLVVIAGVAWIAATLAWLGGAGPVRITPMLGAVLVPTLVAWQRDGAVARRGHPSRTRQRWLVAPAVVLVVGAVGVIADLGAGRLIVAAGLAAYAGCLWCADDASRAWSRRGADGFAARSWSAGRVWLAVAALLWGALGLGASGPFLHDAAVHALFLGFVTSVLMGGTPTLLAALGIRCHLRAGAEVTLALLHVSVAFRVLADLAGSATWRELALHGNTVAVLSFVALVALGVRRHVLPPANLT